MDNLELRHISDRERYKDLLAQSAQEALYYETLRREGTLTRRIARYFGQLIFSLSLTLLRYGKTDLKAFLQCYVPLLEQQER